MRSYEVGRFLVSGIREERLDWLASSPARGVLLSDDAHYKVGVEFSLASPDHPEIEALRCERRFENWSCERPLTAADVRRQIGRFLAIRRASEASPAPIS